MNPRHLRRIGRVTNKSFLFFSVALLFASIILFVVNGAMSAQNSDTPDNERQPKPLEGLPANAEVLSSQEVFLSGDSHPLSLGMDEDGNVNPSEPGLEPLYEYNTAQSTTYLVSGVGIVIHFTYEFTDDRLVQEAYDTILADKFLDGAPIANGEELGIVNAPGTFISWQDPDAGDQAYWHITTADNVLTVLLVNGMPSEELTALFQALVKR